MEGGDAVSILRADTKLGGMVKPATVDMCIIQHTSKRIRVGAVMVSGDGDGSVIVTKSVSKRSRGSQHASTWNFELNPNPFHSLSPFGAAAGESHAAMAKRARFRRTLVQVA